jgi:hypothetical protein
MCLQDRLTKGETSLAITIRTEMIGQRDFLAKRRAQGISKSVAVATTLKLPNTS